jgi:hypothetical protein
MGFDNYRFRNRKELQEENYFYLAGPYSWSEEQMVKRVVADAKRAKRNIAFSGDRDRVEVWQQR